RLHERHRGQRQAGEAPRPQRRLPLHDRIDRGRLLGGRHLIVGSANVETTLLLLKIAFLVLLYLFIWRIVRSPARDLRLPPDALLLSPQQAPSLLPQPSARELGRLVVLKSPTLGPGDIVKLDSHALRVGRGGDNDLSVEGDEFASSHHARFEPRRDGVYV